MSAARQGWRSFRCDECGHEWRLPTRDCYSPSKETCPTPGCGCEIPPYMSELDLALPVDSIGNLLLLKDIS